MAQIAALRALVASLIIVLATAFLRLLYILPSTSGRYAHNRARRPKNTPSHMVAVLGSGGHTAEMMSLLRDIDPTRYTHRTYIVSSGDSFSSVKAVEIEAQIQNKARRSPSSANLATPPSQSGEADPFTGIWDLKIVPRARKIHQPLYTTPFSSIWCLISCLKVLYLTSKSPANTFSSYPDVIVANGPATAVIVILAAIILKFFGVVPLGKLKIIYVESWARVKTLSLSGKLLLWMGVCDRFLVQWRGLEKAINGTGERKIVEWRGFLVD